MQDFYWPKKNVGEPVPNILGLTASPVIGSNMDGLRTLESLLDATCKSPRIQKTDLSLHVKLPTMVPILFNEEGFIANNLTASRNMTSLKTVFLNLNIHDDPEIIRLRTTNTDISRRRLEKALMARKTFIQTQMSSFVKTSCDIKSRLGIWAAEAYVSQVTSSFIQSTDSKDPRFLEWEDAEKRYLAHALRSLELSSPAIPVLPEQESISDKVRVLIQFLESCQEGTIGIIFVKERATAYMLYRLLHDYPDALNRFCRGITVGASKRPSGKRDILDFSHHMSQSNTLEKFRSGDFNLLIATSVLEEGIDVPQCNLVVCFDEPTNLKSFIQRRGRARLRESKLVILLERSTKNRVAEWQRLEHEMKLLYEKEERAVQKLAMFDEGETDQFQRRKFQVSSTGALLDMDSAKGHLECFCSRLSSHSNVHSRPEYIIREESWGSGPDEPPLLSATVILPVSLNPTLRIHESRNRWYSEKNATKDAAFEAYVALHRAGLINDNLLPLSFTETSRYMGKQDSIIEVREQFNPWPGIARAWQNRERIQKRVLTLKDEASLEKCQIEMLIPTNLQNMSPILVYWDNSHQWKIEIGPALAIQHSGLPQDDTSALLSHTYGHRWNVEQLRHVVLFKAIDFEISSLLRGNMLSLPQGGIDDPVGLLRDMQHGGHPYLFQSWLSTKPLQQSIQKAHKDYESFLVDQPFIALKKWSSRSDFLHPVQSSTTDRPGVEYFKVLPQSRLVIDPLPLAISQFGLLIPCLLHKVQVQLVVAELCATVLSEVEILDFDLVRTALSAPVAREQDDYQKLEFLGDSVLKFLVSTFATSKCKQSNLILFIAFS